MKKIFYLTICLLLLPVSVYAASLPRLLNGQTEGIAKASNKKSLDFSGASMSPSANNKYVRVQQLSAMNSEDLTVMVWFKTPPTVDKMNNVYNAIIRHNRSVGNGGGKSADTSVYTKGWALGLVNGKATLSMGSGTSVSDPWGATISSNYLSLNSWHSLAFTRDASASGAPATAFYVDGISVPLSSSYFSNITGGIYDPTAQEAVVMGLGGRNESSSVQSNIILDEAKIYNRALSQDEVMNRQNQTSSEFIDPSGSNLIGYWNFNDVNGITVKDSTGNNDGVLVGGSLPTYVNDSVFPVEQVKSFGGMTGNFAIYNADSPLKLGFDQGLLVTSSSSCYNNIFALPLNCFSLKEGNGNSYNQKAIQLMTSKTKVNGQTIIQTPALYYDSKIVSGDVYGDNMSNFAFWGRNLHQATGDPGSDASWKAGSSPINENAQASWLKPGGVESDQIMSYKAKTNVLWGEAAWADDSVVNSSPTWYLQSTSQININGAKSTVPEGKVWKIASSDSNLTLSGGKQYLGRGTIIINGSLTINSGVNIIPDPSDKNARLGLIVTGDVYIKGSNKINASIFSYGAINIQGSNIEATGSFVGKTFTGYDGYPNVRFFYDYNLDEAWPPGFRNLNMPHPNEAKQ